MESWSWIRSEHGIYKEHKSPMQLGHSSKRVTWPKKQGPDLTGLDADAETLPLTECGSKSGGVLNNVSVGQLWLPHWDQIENSVSLWRRHTLKVIAYLTYDLWVPVFDPVEKKNHQAGGLWPLG